MNMKYEVITRREKTTRKPLANSRRIKSAYICTVNNFMTKLIIVHQNRIYCLILSRILSRTVQNICCKF